MHELSIASSVLEKVLEETKKHGGGKVTEIKLQIGKLSHIMPDALDFAFQTLAEGTPAAKARIDIERVPLRLKCRACGWEGAASPDSFLCGQCKSSDVQVIAGMEMVLASFTLSESKPKPRKPKCKRNPNSKFQNPK
jgi:hydrogenase nickel incorporation protein HypA/HybF